MASTSKSLPKSANLSQLFGRGPLPTFSNFNNNQDGSGELGHLRRILPHHRRNGSWFHHRSGHNFFTLRLEHRQGGATACHKGEERVLLFRSDRAGAIGKIIFSSAPSRKRLKPNANAENLTFSNPEPNSALTLPLALTEEDFMSMTQAKIHVLDVKEEYRGMDLGGLLFAEAIRSLRQKYCTDKCSLEQRGQGIRCQLEAEEDLSRHNKLIRFYQQLGCHIKPNIKAQILYHTDGTTYRKVPMQIALMRNKIQSTPQKRTRETSTASDTTIATSPLNLPVNCRDSTEEETESSKKRKRKYNELSSTQTFLPIHFLRQDGSPLYVPVAPSKKQQKELQNYSNDARRINLLVVQEENGLSFRSTQGHDIQVDCYGNMVAVPFDDDTETKTDIDTESKDSAHKTCNKDSTHYWTKPCNSFHISRVSDMVHHHQQKNKNLPHTKRPTYKYNYAYPHSEDEDDDPCDSEEARLNKLWIIHTTSDPHRPFLGIHPHTHQLTFFSTPMFWQADNSTLSLVYTNDTPERRMHYRKTWKKQSVDYVLKMREKYFNFDLKKMTLKEALEMVKEVKCHPFRVDQEEGPSLRSFLFKAAECARKEGHPDWVQLLALIHELGRVVSCIDPSTSSDSDEDYNWTFAIRSRVLGCAPPPRANFGEFRYLDPDLRNQPQSYNTPNGIYQEHCGLEQLLLSWTGPEYMYFMLKHNGASLPEEGFGVLRLFPLGDWHTHDEYINFTNRMDAEMKECVFDFDKLRKRIRRECVEDLSEEECDTLWEDYYENLAYKYDCGHALHW